MDTLLDGVEIDEVKDVFEIKKDFKIEFLNFNINTNISSSVVFDVFKKAFDILCKKECISGYSFKQVGKYNIWSDCEIIVSFDESAYSADNFVTFAAYVCYCMMEIKDISIKKGFSISITGYEQEKVKIAYSIGNWIVSVNSVLENEFGLSGFSQFGSMFVPIMAGLKIISPIDNYGSRFLLFDMDKYEINMFGSDGILYFNANGRVYFDMTGSLNILNSVAIDKQGFHFDKFGWMVVRTDIRNFNFIDINGNRIKPDGYFSLCCNFTDDGFAKVRFASDGKYGYINVAGERLVIKTEWSVCCGDFSNGVAVIERSSGLKNVIDINGNVLCEKWYDKIEYSGKYARVERYEKNLMCKFYNYIDTTGRILWNGNWFGFLSGLMVDGYALVCNHDNQWNYLKSDGNLLFDTWYDGLCGNPAYGVCSFFSKTDGKWFFIDVNTGSLLFDGAGYYVCEWKEKDSYYIIEHSFYFFTKEFKKNCVSRDGVMLSYDKWFDDISCIGDGCFYVTKKEYGKIWYSIFKWGNVKLFDWYGIDELNGMRSYLYSFGMFANGYLTVWKHEGANVSINYIDKDGRYVSDTWFVCGNQVTPGGFAIVKLVEDLCHDILHVSGKLLVNDYSKDVQDIVVDDSGRFVIVTAIYKKEKIIYGMIDSGGNIVIDWTSDKISFLSSGLLKIGMHAIVDFDGNLVSVI